MFPTADAERLYDVQRPKNPSYGPAGRLSSNKRFDSSGLGGIP
jgi:hypothetical protein